MLTEGGTPPLSRILALRMAATSVAVLLVLTGLYVLRDISDGRHLQEVTLYKNALTIARTLASGRDPAKLPLYRNFPQAYGFRVFDHKVLLTRRVLASANTQWLPPIQQPAPVASDPDDGPDLSLIHI